MLPQFDEGIVAVALEVGQEAPDFTLPNEDGQQVTLSDLRGTPVVLVFYAFDFSGICTSELCGIRDDFSSWMGKGATVFGISRDSRFAHAAFKAQEHLPYSLLADVKGEVACALKNAIPDARDHSQVEAAIA